MNSRTTLRIAAAFAVVGLACATHTGAVGTASMKAIEQPADLILKMKNGTCGFVVRPPTIYANRLRRDKVRWQVTNLCNEDVTAKIDFPKDPFERCTREKMIAKGRTENMRCVVRSNSDNGSHPYDIYINGKKAGDPDVEIWDN